MYITRVDYFEWGIFTEQVYKTEPGSIQYLRNRIASDAEHMLEQEITNFYPKLLLQDCSLSNTRRTGLQTSPLSKFSYHQLITY